MCKSFVLQTADLHTKKKKKNKYTTKVMVAPSIWTWFLTNDNLWSWLFSCQLWTECLAFNTKPNWIFYKILQNWISYSIQKSKRAQVYTFEVSLQNKKDKEKWLPVSSPPFDVWPWFSQPVCLKDNEMRFYHDDLSPIRRAFTMLCEAWHEPLVWFKNNQPLAV